MNTTPEQAYEAGWNACEAGRSIGTCPMFGPGEDGYQLRSAWRRGWVDRNTAKAREVTR